MTNHLKTHSRFWSLLLALASAALFAAADAGAPVDPRAVQIHRTWMPDASPSSFAVGFPGGLNVCFDAMRGNVIYAWAGDYVDLQPTVNGKIPRDAVIRGKVFYENKAVSAFRLANASGPAEIRFTGHRLKGGFPEFHYDVDGVPVAELVRPAADGTGIIRQFRIATADRALSFQPDPANTITIESGPAEWAGGTLRVPGNATVVFTVKIARP